MKRILIAGCGDIGVALGLSLTAAGHGVWGLKRRPNSLPPSIQPLQADLNAPNSLAILPPKLDAVVYAAAAGGYTPERYRIAYQDGVANILQALQAQGQSLQRFIFVSSTSVYGQSSGEWVDEDSPALAEGFASDTLRAGERLAWSSPVPATVIRFGGIYGPGRTRLLDSVTQGTAKCSAGVYTNRIHRDDCAGALSHILMLKEPAPLYLGVDNDPAEQCEVMRWLAQQLSVTPPPQANVDSSPEQRMRGNKRCRNDRLRAAGYRFLYPSYREGYAAQVQSERFAQKH